MIVTILSAVLVLGVLIFIHENGHFLAAKLFRIRVERYSIGYPPRLFGKKIGETDYCVSAIPFGGYVKIAGMVDESMDKKALAKPPMPWEYRSRPWIQRFLVIFAGPLLNVLFAFLVYMAATLWYGIAETDTPVIETVLEGQPAQGAGIRPGDLITAVGDESIETWDELVSIIHASPEKPLEISWKRGDSLFTKVVIPVREKVVVRGDIREVGLVGMGAKSVTRKATVPEGIANGAVTVYNMTKLVLNSLWRLITGKESVRSLAGPIFIAKMAGESARSGLSALLGFMAFLSLNLGILNLLPIPALDGGHLGYLAVEGIIRKPLPIKLKLVIQQVGMVLLLGLMVYVIYSDILRLFQK